MRPLASRSDEVPSSGTPSAARHAAERFLRAALSEASAGERVRVCTVTAPVGSATALLDVAPAGPSLFFAAPSETAYAGLGIAEEITLAGPARFIQLREAAEQLFAGLREVRAPGAVAAPPRLFGGLSFATADAHDEPWSSFGDGVFVLPRWTYAVGSAGATLSLAMRVSAAPREVEEAVRELRDLWECLERGTPDADARSVRTVGVAHLGLAPWREQVEAIRAAIREGRFRKVVAARRAVVDLDRPVSPREVVARLAARFPGCAQFAFVREGSAFVGATPERLVEKRGASVKTEALAGSMARGRGRDLLSSKKDHEEHALVVDAIVEGLAPFCVEVTAAKEPRIRELPNVLHMQTPIEGRLREGVHVVDLVGALHPTPAVGGVPTAGATEWIAEKEHAPRGWYSAPLGWLDAAGDGAFVVALRSGLVRGDRAYVYAGAGIVRDSEPTTEYEETELKMQALLGALDEDLGA